MAKALMGTRDGFARQNNAPALAVKVSLVASVDFGKPTERDAPGTHGEFRSDKQELLTPSMPIEQVIERIINPFEEAVRRKTEKYNACGSGYHVSKIQNINMELHDYPAFHGAACTEKPALLAQPKYGIFVRQKQHLTKEDRGLENQRCFRLAVEVCASKAMCPGKKTSNLSYKDFTKAGGQFNWAGIRFPSTDLDFDRFEQNNSDVALTIWDWAPKEKKQGQIPGLRPYRISTRLNAKHRFDLLRVVTHYEADEGEMPTGPLFTFHLFPMKSYSKKAILRQQRGNSGDVCRHCDRVFSSHSHRLELCPKANTPQRAKVSWQQRKAEHEAICKGRTPTDGQETCLAKRGKHILKVDVKKKNPIRSYIVFDIEAYNKKTGKTRPLNADEYASWTTTTSRQAPCVIGAAVVSDNKVVKYWQSGYKEPVKEFLRWLCKTEEGLFKKQAARQRDWKKTITSKELEIWEQATTCVICNEEVADKDKCLHHNHFTGRPVETGCAHIECNSKHQVQSFLPVLAFNHNYDLTYLLQEIAENSETLLGREFDSVPHGSIGKYLTVSLNARMEEYDTTLAKSLRYKARTIYDFDPDDEDHPCNGLTYKEIAEGGHQIPPSNEKLKDWILRVKPNTSIAKFIKNYDAVKLDPKKGEAKAKGSKRIGLAIKFLDAQQHFGAANGGLAKIVESLLPVPRKKFKTDEDWLTELRKPENIKKIRSKLKATSTAYPDDDELLEFRSKEPFHTNTYPILRCSQNQSYQT